MAVNVRWLGKGRVAEGNVATETWSVIRVDGSGNPGSPAAADGAFEGTNAVTFAVNGKNDAIFVDLGAGNELDFSSGGTEEGQLIYIWGSFLAPALFTNNLGTFRSSFGIFLESTTPNNRTQYHIWYFDDSTTYTGGFKRFILDPRKPASNSLGTAIDISSIRYIGLFADTTGNTARFDNLIVDAIYVGNGLVVDGTSTTDAFISDMLLNESTNRYGIISSLNDSDTAVQLAGLLRIGDNVGSNTTSITDINSKIFTTQPVYANSSVANTTSVPLDSFKIELVGNSTGATDVQFGKKVGTDAGRNGISIVGNDLYNVGIDFDDGLVNTNNWYGCSFENLTGTLSWGANTSHDLFSSSFSGCSQFDPVGGIEIRNTNFTAVKEDGVADASSTAALLWNSSADVEDCNFLANFHTNSDIAHGIEYPSAGTFSATGLNFSGNEVGILFSAASGDLVINAQGGTNLTQSAGTPTGFSNNSTGTVTINSTISATFTNIIKGSEIRVYSLDGNGDILEEIPISSLNVGNEESISNNVNLNTGSVGYSLDTLSNYLVKIIKVDYNIVRISLTTGTTNIDRRIEQSIDRVYSNS